MANKAQKILITLLFSIYALYCLASLVLVPTLLKPFALEKTNHWLRGELRVESLSFNPFTNSFTFADIQVDDEAGNNLLLLEKLYINFDLLPLLGKNLHLKTIEADKLILNNSSSSESETNDLSSQQWLFLPNLLIDNLTIGLNSQSVISEAMSLHDLQANLRVDHQGGNNIKPFIEQFIQLFTRENKSEEDQSTESKSWLLVFENLSLLNAAFEVTDSSLQPPATSTLNNVDLYLKDIHSDLSKAIKIDLELNAFEGLLTLKGKIHPQSMESEFTYALEKIQLKNLNSYANYFTYLQIENGELNSSGSINTLRISTSEISADENTGSDSPQNTESTQNMGSAENTKSILNVSISNNNNITQLFLKREDEENPFLQCESISYQDLQYMLAGSSLNLSDFVIDQCVIYALIHQDGSTNFDLVKNRDTAAQDAGQNPGTETDPETANPALNISISGIYLKDSLLSLKDLSQGEPANITIKNIEGSVTNIQLGDKYLSPLKLTGMVNEHAPLEIKGQGNFVNSELSLKTDISLKTLGLKAFSPYTLNLSKRAVEKGALSLNLSYQLENNIIDGKNIVLIENLDMGSKQNIESAHNLPLGLAVSVLKDSKGNINIDIPVKGDLDDPTFSVNKQILRALAGLISKAATSPLTALSGLGSMVTKQENASEFIFEAGSTKLHESSDKKVAALAQTLKAHPELALKIVAHTSQQDLVVLKAELAAQPPTTTQRSTLEFNPDMAITFLKQRRVEHLRSRLMALGILSEQLVLPEAVTATEEAEKSEQENTLMESSVRVELFAR